MRVHHHQELAQGQLALQRVGASPQQLIEFNITQSPLKNVLLSNFITMYITVMNDVLKKISSSFGTHFSQDRCK